MPRKQTSRSARWPAPTRRSCRGRRETCSRSGTWTAWRCPRLLARSRERLPRYSRCARPSRPIPECPRSPRDPVNCWCRSDSIRVQRCAGGRLLGLPEEFVELSVEVDEVAFRAPGDDPVSAAEELGRGAQRSLEVSLAERRRERDVQDVRTRRVL